MDVQPKVVYFSMEIALDPAIPTYSGGLGVLAGDTLRAAADLGLPTVGVSLLYRKGYFRQHLDPWGNQSEAPTMWVPEQHLEPLQARVAVTIAGRQVLLRGWRYRIRGESGSIVPVYLLDADVPENAPEDRALTDNLYGGDARYRLSQEALLAFGGLSLLRVLRHNEVRIYHMNEGHSAFLGLALLEERTLGGSITEEEIEAVRQRCVFTTHTPVPAGHDQFPVELVEAVLGEHLASDLETAGCCLDGTVNMTYVALRFSRHVNGVALSHGRVAQGMYPDYPIDAITNGVHALTWTSPSFQRLYDHHISHWRQDNLALRYAIGIPLEAIRQAHEEAKEALLAEIARRTGVQLDSGILTIGFARRATPYKRADLVFTDVNRLRRIVQAVGPLQIVYGGKAHPRDEGGKAVIRRVFEGAAALRGQVRVVYLEEYDMEIGKLLCAGADLWLNTPQRPQEASGTSGMKAALNGVPSLSVRDGWWAEGHVEGVTGWGIGDDEGPTGDPAREAASLYDKLERVILPLFYTRPREYARVMRWAIALNGSYYNTERMLLQYARSAYLLEPFSA